MEKNKSLEALREPFRTKRCVVHGVSLRGISHEAGNMPLQDSYAAAELENGWIVLAVADGVGSEPRAEVGAEIAAETVVDHLRRLWGYRVDDRSVERMLYAAYQAACAEIFARAVRDGAPFRTYSTTLHTVIFSDGLLYIMHAGDGGVAILTEEGEFQRVTHPMKGEDGESVVPLQGGPERWQFSVCRERAQSVIVATDGLWDKLCPPILRAYGDERGVEQSIASFFLSPWARNWREAPLQEIVERETRVFRGEPEAAIPEFYETLVQAVAQGGQTAAAQEVVKTRVAPGNVPVKMLRGIKDDITLLTLVRFDPTPEPMPLERFSPPDWAAVNRWVSERLYAREAAEPEAEAEKPESEAATPEAEAAEPEAEAATPEAEAEEPSDDPEAAPETGEGEAKESD